MNRASMILLALLIAPAGTAVAATYQVGPQRPHTTLQALLGAVTLAPGDIVEVDGNRTYAGGVVITSRGTPEAPIVFRGIAVNGQMPSLSGATNTVEFRGARDVVFDGFDVTGGSSRCVFNLGHRITVRNALIHDCPSHGILGADNDSGSFTLEFSEVRHCGSTTQRHPLYMQTDEVAHPGSVVRIRHNYIHSGNGGNLLKSRAERTEVHYNWFEGARYHEVELIGPDPFTQQPGWSEDLVREDHEMIGNVIIHTNAEFGSLVRLGGDGTGQSNGRYRLAHNTFIASTGTTALRLFDGIESIELHNNVFHRPSSGSFTLMSSGDVTWTHGEQVVGSNNWIRQGTTGIPAALQQTRLGSDPQFADLSQFDLRPASSASPLHDQSAINPGPVNGYAFPNPSALPPVYSPARTRHASAQPRPSNGVPDIGAFERGSTDRLFADDFE
jgi:hypothetical protein